MPWKEQSVMSQRREFVTLASAPGANKRALCRRFGISPTTAYKWLDRHRAAGAAGLEDRSRRPHASPGRSADATEAAVLALRAQHPAWGGRKIRRRLQDLGRQEVPAASTVGTILKRHGQIDPAAARARKPLQRFERPEPNQLWQMDFKGHFATDARRCHPLTVLDDHARFSLAIQACADERERTVRQRLEPVFERYGLPEAMLMDRGSPWGPASADDHWTGFAVWLVRLGIKPLHGRPYHPQTQGKEERFHRTLLAEAIGARRFRDLAEAQARFDAWRQVYNHERPHQALGLATPAQRYRPSPRCWPASLPPIAYADGDRLRKVGEDGRIAFQSRRWRVGRAFAGAPVALRPASADGVWDVAFCHLVVKQIDLRKPEAEP